MQTLQQEINYTGAMALIGSAIRLAIEDYQTYMKDPFIAKRLDQLREKKKLTKEDRELFYQLRNMPIHKREPRHIRKLAKLQRRQKLNPKDHQQWLKLSAIENNFETARLYLFDKDWLESQLTNTGLDAVVNIDAIRREAREYTSIQEEHA